MLPPSTLKARYYGCGYMSIISIAFLKEISLSSVERKMTLPGGESNPALARSVGMTGACTKPIYYQGLHHICKGHIVGSADDHNHNDRSLSSASKQVLTNSGGASEVPPRLSCAVVLPKVVPGRDRIVLRRKLEAEGTTYQLM